MMTITQDVTNCLRVYNATNHDVNVYYLDNENFLSHRYQNKYFLLNETIRPIVTYSQKVPLSTDKQAYHDMRLGNISFTYPDMYNTIEPLKEYHLYDVIIVSRRYGESVINALLGSVNDKVLLMDYIDRLYLTSEQVVYKNKTIGTIGLSKLTNPMNVWFYLELLRSGRKPSLLSSGICVDNYKYTNEYMCNMYLRTCVDSLKRYIDCEVHERYNGNIYMSANMLYV